MSRSWKASAVLLALCLMVSGCTRSMTQETTAPTVATKPRAGIPGQSAASDILKRIWDAYEEQERFAVYGGMMEHPAENAPGDLDMQLAMLWAPRYRVPLAHLDKLEQGASLCHLMNGNLLTVTVFGLAKSADTATIAWDWRWELQHSYWVAGQPSRLLLARAEKSFLLMAFGSKEQMQTLKEKLLLTCPADILYDEPITS